MVVALVVVVAFAPLQVVADDDSRQWQSSTIAGTGSDTASGDSGQATECAIAQPFGVEVGPDNCIYVTEVGHHRIWKIDIDSGSAVVIAGNGQKGYSGDGGPATEASLNEPYEVRFDQQGNLFFVEMQNHLIRRIDAQTGTISTVAGTGKAGFSGDGGPATKAQFNRPHSLVVDDRQQRLYVADIGNHRIRVVDLQTGTIMTLAGNGDNELPVEGQIATGNPLIGPRALALADHRLWIALREGHSLWYLDLDAGTLHHATGDGQIGFEQNSVEADRAHFNGPKGIALTPDGQVAIVDTENHAIRLYSPSNKRVSTIAGSGPTSGGFQEVDSRFTSSRMSRPHGIAVDQEGRIYVGDTNNHRVRLLIPPR